MQTARKDKTIAMVLEILPGLFGFLGIGWLYAGNTTAGIIWLAGFLVWNVIAAVVGFFTLFTSCICTGPINLVAIGVSAFMLYNYTKSHPELFGV